MTGPGGLLGFAPIDETDLTGGHSTPMLRRILATLLFLVWTLPAAAQDSAWVQIEAQPTLSSAQERARAYAAALEDVSGYYLGSGWYGIVLGPYAPADAEAVLRRYRAAGQIPADSFVAFGNNFSQQFWPVGVGTSRLPQPLPEGTVTPEETTEPGVDPVAEVVVPDPIQPADETVQQARASEAQLTRDEKRDLQVALQWAGFYTGAIDGLYGRGTRSSMEAWQVANNHEATGVLTTAQRAELVGAYNAVLEGMDLQYVRDEASGIEMLVPTGVVAFAEYEPPFVRFGPKGDLQARVLFISQEGDQDRLFGLYEILQTLEIVPPEGPRQRGDRSFKIEGIGDEFHTYIQADLREGRIKGFALIWPAGDEDRRSRVLGEMRDSFARIDGVLDPAIAVPGEDQAIDLVSGLEVRKPVVARSGFFINEAGDVLTTTDVLQNCGRLSVDAEHDAEISFRDDDLGIAVLTPTTALAPLAVAEFQTAVPRIKAEIAVAGFPFGGILTSPALTFGTLADIRGLAGEDTLKRLQMQAEEGDAGGPVFDNSGAVLGMLLPRATTGGRSLPADVSFIVDSDAIRAAIVPRGLPIKTTDSLAYMPPETLTNEAAKMTVLVSCWD